MCGRFTLRTSAQAIAEAFAVTIPSELQLAPRYNIAPTQPVAVVRNADGHRQLQMMQWGLVPSWSADPKGGAKMINARSETAAAKPAFRDAIERRRCLIPADGFFEWQTVGRRKQPYYIRLKEDRPFAFTGLWERWSKGDQPLESCTILTTRANDLLAPLHDRMPVILSPADYETWLDPNKTDPASLNYLFDPFPSEDLAVYPVNPVVNSAKFDAAECVEPVAEDSPPQTSLFPLA